MSGRPRLAGRAALSRMVSRSPFARRYGFRVSALGPGRCRLDAPFRPVFERAGGIVGGPVLVAAADLAMWLAILTRLGPDDGSVTAEMNTAFLRALRGEGFRCTARIVRLGRRRIFGVAECVTATGALVAHSTLSYLRPEVSPGSSSPRAGSPARGGRRRSPTRPRRRG